MCTMYMGFDLWVLNQDSWCLSLSETPFADLTDVTLADEDTNSILTDDSNWTIPVWHCKWRHVVAKFKTDASGATWWMNL